MPASDLTLYAKWDLNSYTITFNSLGGSSVEPLTVNYNEAIIAPEEPTRTGYTFSGWYSDESLTNLFIFTSMPASDLTLYAKWDINSYTVTFNSLGGSNVEALRVNYNEAIIAPEEPTRTGYSFSGWYSDINLTTLFIFTSMPASDLTLYAKWDLNSYTVTFNSLGGSSVLPLDVFYNSLINIPEDPVKEGYSFVGWYTEIDLINSFDFTNDYMPASNLTLYAKWSINTYSVTFYQTEEDVTPGIVFEVLYVTYGSDVFLDNLSGLPEKSSTTVYVYEFKNWNGNLLNVTENREIYPVYEESLREYDVNFYSDDILIFNQKVYYGKSATPP